MGQSFASRVAASLLNAVGLSELITSNQEEYESLAIELAMNPNKLADIKEDIIKFKLSKESAWDKATLNSSVANKNIW